MKTRTYRLIFKSMLSALVAVSFAGRSEAAVTVLHRFSQTTGGSGFASSGTNVDGAYSRAGLVQSGNTLYGTTTGGGEWGNGTIFKVNTDGSGFEVLHTFSQLNSTAFSGLTNEDGVGPQSGLVVVGSTLYGTALAGGLHSQGTLFEINTDGTGFTVLHYFVGLQFGQGPNDGATPWGGLLASGSTLYGVTEGGGDNSSGALYAIDTSGADYRVIHHFSALNLMNSTNVEGSFPQSALVLSGNMLYGTARLGGQFDNGTVFGVSTDGLTVVTLHNFTVPTGTAGIGGLGTNGDGTQPISGLAVSGNALYGTTPFGGESGNGTVFKLNTDGSGFATLHSFSAVAPPQHFATNGDGAIPYSGLALSGNVLYGTAAFGGDGKTSTLAIAGGVIFSVNSDGTGFMVVHNFTGVNEGENPESTLLISGGKIYGMTSASGESDGRGSGTAFSLVAGSGAGSQGSLRVNLSPPAAITAGAQWQIDGGTFENSGTTVGSLSAGAHTLSFKEIPGFTAPATRPVTIVANTTVTVTGTYTGPDTTRPTVTITYPKSGARLSNGNLVTLGTAADNVAVEGVYYALNGGAWTPAISVNGWKDWAGGILHLVPGTNSLSVYSMDTSGNDSRTNTEKFVYVVTNKLTVEVEGRGTLTPNLNNKFLALNTGYKMAATAAPGFAFGYWGGGVSMTTNRTLSFLMTPDLDIVVVFDDIARPVDVITFPTANKTWTNSFITVTGKAHDNVSVSNVWYQLNTNAWAQAMTTNGFANWIATNVDVGPGTNMVRSFAVDGAGNMSRTNSIRFRVLVP